MLKFCSIASGSSGNCYYIESEKTALLVDLGIAGKRITQNLEELDVALSKIEYVFLTHEHEDHIKSLSVMGKKLGNADFYASEGTWLDLEEKKLSLSRRNLIKAGQSLQIADITVKAFDLSHDANEPIGYIFQSGEASIAIVTDTGRITAKCKKALKEAVLLVLESNYEEALLMASQRYPWQLKRRIRGKHGHLSNEDAANTVEQILSDGETAKLQTLILAHLSKETNYPELAFANMEARLAEICTGNRKIYLDVATREERSAVYIIR